jgi:hypothetical protein
LLVKYWASNTIVTLLISTFIYLGYLSFGYPVYFDRLFIIVLLILVSTFKVNKNLFLIGLILLLERILSTLLFEVTSLLLTKVLTYSVCFYIVYKLTFDKQVKFLLLPVVIISILAELYWYFIEYTAPYIHTYIALMCLNLVTRYFLIFKVHIFKRTFPDSIFSLPLDFSLYKVAGLYNLVLTAMISEYLIRHLTFYNPMIIYFNYSFLTQLAALGTLYLIFLYIFQSSFRLKA